MPTNNAKGLEEVLGLLEKATPGEFRYSETLGACFVRAGDREPISYRSSPDAENRANAAAMAAAVNYLRSHGAAIAELIVANKEYDAAFAVRRLAHVMDNDSRVAFNAAAARRDAALRQVEGQ